LDEQLKWFDGYEGQRTVILDDFRKNNMSFSLLLRLLDRYCITVPVKGGYTCWNPLTIIITCTNAPHAEFVRHNDDNTTTLYENIGQLDRRITQVMHF